MQNSNNILSEKMRVDALDVWRGFALLGILVVNALQMFNLGSVANSPLAFVEDENYVWASWSLIHAIFDTKFLTMFSLLFGCGFMLQWESNNKKDSNFRWQYIRRLTVLACMGIIHGIYLYSYDVLFLYALAGFVLYFCRKLSSSTLITSGTILFLLSILEFYFFERSIGLEFLSVLVGALVIIVFVLLARNSHPLIFIASSLTGLFVAIGILFFCSSGTQNLRSEFIENHHQIEKLSQMEGDTITFSDFASPFPLSHEVIDRVLENDNEEDMQVLEYVAYRFGPNDLLNTIRANNFLDLVAAIVIYFLWRTLGIFLIAAGLVKWGILSIENKVYWSITLKWGLGLGAIFSIAATAMTAAEYFYDYPFLSISVVLHEISALLIAASVGCLCLLWNNKNRLNKLKLLFSSCGRMALTNYIGQSVVMGLIATGYGLGLFGSLTHIQLILLSISVYFILAVFSARWMSVFKMGPLEWIWRCFTYKKLVSISR